MNGRRIVWLAIFTLGLAAVLAAMSAVADPANINNPPTNDWFFDSGDDVVIAHRTWDINYNITVANDTFLVFDGCTFTFSDPADINSRSIHVMWNGSMRVDNCTFKSTGTAKYFIYVENTTSFWGSSISGMKAPGNYRGGISALWTDIDFKKTTISDTEGVAVWTENCNIVADWLSVSTSGGDYTDGASFTAMYMYNSWEDMFDLTFTNCQFSNNPYRGFGLRAYSNWADITAKFTNCNFDSNEQRGLDIYWGRDYSYESTNASLDLTMSQCMFDGNGWDGFRYQQYDVRRNADSSVSITLDDCDFLNGEGSGAFINVYRGDQAFDILVNDCEFVDNAKGGRAGLALKNVYLYSVWNVTVTDCIFTNNDFYGMHVEHRSTTMDGGSYIITGCAFTDHTESLYIYNYRFGDYYNEFWIEGCTFSQSKNAGIFQYVGYSMLPLEVHLEACDFSDSDGGGIASRGAGDQSDGVLWEIMNCTFKDLGDRAIKFHLDYVMSGATLDIHGCTLDETAGIEFMVANSIPTAHPEHVLRVVETDVTNSSASAIEAVITGFYGVGLTVEIEEVTITEAMFNGLRIVASSNYAAATATIDVDLDINDLTIDTVNGIGIDAGTDKIDYGGTRTIYVDGLDISTVNKALLLYGLKGELYRTSIAGSLNEDVTAINSDVEIYQPTLDALDEDTVEVIESGSVKFWYVLKVYVNWDTGNAVEGAVIEISDNQRTLIGTFTQYDDTGLAELMLNSFQFRSIGQFTRSPYILNVTFRAIQKVVPVTLVDDTTVTIELADHVPPQVFINEPLPGHIQKTTTIHVRGSSFDSESAVDKVEVSLDGVNWIKPSTTTEWASWAHTFVVTEQDVIDNGGIFNIRARATDAAGNDATVLTAIEIDPFPPYLQVDFPYDGLQTNIPTIEVRGVTERGANVEVNGVGVALVDTLFLTQLDLKEGPNTITVATFDALGNAMQVKMEVVLDTKLPYLVLLTPEEGEMFTKITATVSGQAEDGLKIWVNDNALGDTDYNNGTFEYEVSLKRGDNTITVRAMDMAGNDLHLTRMVILDDVIPVLAIQSPMDGSHQNTMTIYVAGTTDPDAILLINGEVIDLEHNLFAYSFVGVEDENTIVITAASMAGNVASVTLNVFIDTVGPTMVITSPIGDTDLVTSGGYIISGEAAGGAHVWVNGERHDIATDGTFSVPVTLLEGENRFIITIEDLAGNSVTENRYVTLDTIPPVLVVLIPDAVEKDNSTTFKTKKGEPSMMTITGFTDDAVKVRANGELVPISNDGYFVIDYLLNVNTANTITITAEDTAGNEATWTQTVTHKHLKDPGDEGFDMGLLILIVGLIFLALAIFVGWKRLSSVEEQQELRTVEEDEVLAPAAMPEVEEEEEEEMDEDADLLVDEDEEVHELTPPGERPRTDTSRPAHETADEVTIEIDEKDLEEKDADADVDADESEQEEGI